MREEFRKTRELNNVQTTSNIQSINIRLYIVARDCNYGQWQNVKYVQKAIRLASSLL